MGDDPKPRRRWFRFGLRKLLVFTAIVGLLMGWILKERRQSAREQELANQFSRQGIAVRFFGRDTLDPNEGWWQAWMRRHLGDRIGEVYWSPGSSDLSPLAELSSVRLLYLTDDHAYDLSPLSRLKTLEFVHICTSQVRDLTPISGLVNLRSLSLTSIARFADLQRRNLAETQTVDLPPLAGLKKLQSLGVLFIRVTDINQLDRLTTLTGLCVVGTGLSREQIEALQKALPNCKIEHDPFP